MTKKQERDKWQAQDDAYTMARYNEIMADKERARRAMAEAKAQAKALQRQADAMKGAATRDVIIYNKPKTKKNNGKQNS